MVNIVISGKPASGKGTLRDFLAGAFFFEPLSVGDVTREFMLAKGLKLEERNSIPKSWDMEIDAKFRQRLETEPRLVAEGHYIGFHTRESPVYRILLQVSFEEAYHRRSKQVDKEPETLEQFRRRWEELASGFKMLYGDYDHHDPTFFHLVIDTDQRTKQQVQIEAISGYLDFIKKDKE